MAMENKSVDKDIDSEVDSADINEVSLHVIVVMWTQVFCLIYVPSS